MNDGKYGKTALIDDVTANTQGLTRKQVETIVNATLETIQKKLQLGQSVTITGFGTFQTSQRQARMGTNPQTKQKIQIPARTSARWTPSANFLGTKKSNANFAKERAAGRS